MSRVPTVPSSAVQVGAGAAAAPTCTLDEDPYSAVLEVLARGGPDMVFQAQFSLARLRVRGYEALASFSGPSNSELWFDRAHACGLGARLEAAAVGNALRAAQHLPAGTVLAVNVSPGVLGTPELDDVLPQRLDDVEVELTEHDSVADPGRVAWQLQRLRRRGARIAVDDVGAGYNGLQRVMQLRPDVLKLDRQLVARVSRDHAKAALVRAVVDFGRETGAAVCAEGVETVDDLLALADLDVDMVQGWTVAHGAPRFLPVAPFVAEVCASSLERVLAGPGRPGAAGGPAAAGSAGAGADDRAADAVEGPDDAAWTDTVHHLDRLLGRIADVRDVPGLARALGTATGVIGCDRLELGVLTDDGRALRTVRATGPQDEGPLYRLDDFPLTRACLAEGRVVPVYDLPGHCRAEREQLQAHGHRSALLVPVVALGGTVGLLECFTAHDAPWTRSQVRHARLLASVVGPVLVALGRTTA